MIVIAIVSAKGGVGKTTITANLGVGFAERGYPVTIIDLDPQNAMQWHLGGLEEGENNGVSLLTGARAKLMDACYTSPFGVNFVPFGHGGEVQRMRFEKMLEEQESWLRKKLQAARLANDTIVLLDTPPGPSVYLKQAIHAADFLLVVVLADAASYSTLPEMEELIATYGHRSQADVGSAYIVNQGSKRQLAQDVVALIADRLGERMVPFIVQESPQVEEALAFERPILEYKPDNPASQTIRKIIDWLEAGLQGQH
ncbi:cellulose biosynthesis protein BcsQ [Undibacterium sp. TS12]|uniref:cellulose biosynthesis protein BcsQ n=1 Tax=Undibacterium sp. TS12 TaxID=2908202 RepID=UPI001F4D2274|nr:cellulose biosynthesis protein BcsQ [Undibacterium sp. TS12]MCH8622859.1 cellulose biosynthesis protein BcsQ [Undibacterium sp. TS12]